MPTSAPRLGSLLPLHRDCAHPCHICAGVPAWPTASGASSIAAGGRAHRRLHVSRVDVRYSKPIGVSQPAWSAAAPRFRLHGSGLDEARRHDCLPLYSPPAAALVDAAWEHSDKRPNAARVHRVLAAVSHRERSAPLNPRGQPASAALVGGGLLTRRRCRTSEHRARSCASRAGA